MKKNHPSILVSANAYGKCQLSPALKQYSLKRSKHDRNVYYLQHQVACRPKIVRKQPSAKTIKLEDAATTRTACSTQHATQTFFQMDRYPNNDPFQMGDYLQEMKKCLQFEQTRGRKIVSRTPPPERTASRNQLASCTSEILLRKKIKAAFRTDSIRDSLLAASPVYQPKEGTRIDELFQLIEDQPFTLLKVGTLTNEYVLMECIYKEGLVWAVNDRNELEVGFTFEHLNRMLARFTPQPIYTRISRYGLMEFEEIDLIEPLVNSDCSHLQHVLYLFLEKFADSRERILDPTKKMWIRDSTGRLCFIQLEGIICEKPDPELLKQLQETTVPFRKTSSQSSLHRFGSRVFRLHADPSRKVG